MEKFGNSKKNSGNDIFSTQRNALYFNTTIHLSHPCFPVKKKSCLPSPPPKKIQFLAPIEFDIGGIALI